MQIEILRLLFLILIGRRRCRGGRQVLRVLLLSRRLLLNEVGMMGVLAVVAVAAATSAGIGENLMAVRVPMQMLSGVLSREGRRGNVPHVCTRHAAPTDAAALAVPGAAAAGKVRFVRVVCHWGRWGRHLEKKGNGVARLAKNIYVEVAHSV